MLNRVRALENWLARHERSPLPWLVLPALFFALQVSTLWYPTPDAAAYLSIARSIADGQLAQYADTHLSLPIGYPLLISPAFWLGPRPFLALSIMHFALAMVFMFGLYRWAQRQIDAGAIWFTLLVLANINVGIVYRRTLSEMAFLAVMIWTVTALDAALTPAKTTARLLWCAVLLAWLTTIREVGVLFVAGFALALALRVRRDALPWRTAAAPLLATAAAVLVAMVLVRPERIAAAGPVLAGHLDGYADVGAAVARSFAIRLHLRVTEVGQLLVPGMFTSYGRSWLDINSLVYVPLFIAVAWGWWMRLRLQRDVFTLTAPLFFGAYLLWPYTGGTRYLLPLLPLLVACLWPVIQHVPLWRSLVALSILLHLGVATGHWLIKDRPEARACVREWDSIDHLAADIRAADIANGAATVPLCSHLLLQLTLDRRVRMYEAAGPVDSDIRWLLTRDGDYSLLISRMGMPFFSREGEAPAEPLGPLRRAARREPRPPQ